MEGAIAEPSTTTDVVIHLRVVLKKELLLTLVTVK